MGRLVGLLAIAVLIGGTYLLSRDRRSVNWRQIAWGIGLQLCLAVLLLRDVPFVRGAFESFAEAAAWFLQFGDRGAEFLFGSLATGEAPVTGDDGETRIGIVQLGTIVILKILPTIIFVSSAMSMLYHLGILQRVVQAMAWVVTRTLRVSGAEALSAAANVFIGMTEAPLMIRPYLRGMTSSELMAVMVGGFATISGSMMAVYHNLFQVRFEFLLAASIINAPAALYLTKLYLPEKEVPATLGTLRVQFERDTVNLVDAAASGATIGMKLALNVGAMLLAFAAGLELVDAVLARLGEFFLPADRTLSLGVLLGWLFAPLAWLMGTPAVEMTAVGQLLGKKIALNEFFAYQDLQQMELSEKGNLIATFALCGFANFGSIAIQLGGFGGLVPERRHELARLGVRAMVLGAMASLVSAAVAGIVLGP